MNKKIKLLQYLIVFSSIVFTIYASLNEKSDDISNYIVYLILYGAVFCPPIALDIILKSIKKMHKNEMFGLKLLRNTAIFVILLILAIGEFSSDSILLVPWLLILIYSLGRLYRILSHMKQESNNKNDE